MNQYVFGVVTFNDKIGANKSGYSASNFNMFLVITKGFGSGTGTGGTGRGSVTGGTGAGTGTGAWTGTGAGAGLLLQELIAKLKIIATT